MIPDNFYEKDCTRCWLGKVSPLHGWTIVIGKGNLKANILIVGEAPGKEEAESGLPFVGRAGKMLDTILEAAGLTLNDVYITNTVMHRPVHMVTGTIPKNRQPFPEEIDNCREFRLNKIDYIQPKLIIVVGKTACNWFFSEVKIERGTVYCWVYNGKSYRFLHLFHPAALLYNPNNRQVMEKDLMRNMTLLKSLKYKGA